MIRAVYEPKVPALTLRGHAESAPKGSDTVCAAASILMLTLAETAGREPRRLRDGLSVRGGDRDAYEFAAAGCRLLAENRPECVEYSEVSA